MLICYLKNKQASHSADTLVVDYIFYLMAEIKHKEYFHSISQMVMKQSKNSLDELYKL